MGHHSQKKTPSPPFVAADRMDTPAEISHAKWCLWPTGKRPSSSSSAAVKHSQFIYPFIHPYTHLSINLSEENYADSLKYFIIVVVIEFILEIDLTKNNQIDSETTKTSPSSSSSPAVLV